MIWGYAIVWYLFLAGLAAGAFATAALVALGRQRGKSQGIQRIGRLISLAAVAVGLILLMVDAEAGIQNPMRFIYLLTNFNSVMTWGVVILAGFGLVSSDAGFELPTPPGTTLAGCLGYRLILGNCRLHRRAVRRS